MKTATHWNRPLQENERRARQLRAVQWLILFVVIVVVDLGGAGLVPVRAADAPELPPLTMAPGSSRLPGKFVWADLVTDNVAAAQKFYGPVLGWSFRPAGRCVVASVEDRPIAGMFQLERPKDRPEARPRWFGYISVANVEKIERAVTKAGGRVVAPTREVPRRGKQAVFADPEGALFGVVKSSSGDPEDVLADPGEWIWIQLLSRDARRAAEFYRGVAGYDIVENSHPGSLSDYVLVSKGFARATVRTIRESQKVRPSWMPFVRVKSLTDCLAQVGSNGGKVLLNPSPELLGGKLAVIADPTGAELGVIEWSGQGLGKDRLP